MLDAQERMEISVLSKHGGSIRSIARATVGSRNMVRCYLRGDGSITAKRKPATKRIEKLDPFKDYILERLRVAAPDKILAAVLFREIRHRGYDERVWTPRFMQEESSMNLSTWSGADVCPASSCGFTHAAGPYGNTRIGSITFTRA